MGEAKRRKLLDPNYGKVEIVREIVVYPLFISSLNPDLAKEIVDKYRVAKNRGCESIFIVRGENAEPFADAFVDLTRSWLSTNEIPDEIQGKLFFPFDDDSESLFLLDFIDTIRRRQNRKPALTIVVNESGVGREVWASVANTSGYIFQGDRSDS